MPATNYVFQVRTPIVRGGVTRLELPSSRMAPVSESSLTILRQFPSEIDLSGGALVIARDENPQDDPARSRDDRAPSEPAAQIDYQLVPRRTHKLRDIAFQYSWWESKSNGAIDEPPALSDQNPEKGNIFIHWVQPSKKCQLWLYDVVNGEGIWKRAVEGHVIPGPNQLQLYLVVTEGCQPSLVQLATWDKQYKRRETPVLEP
ncbi:hypothetical protein BJ138DRAFT_1118119 [Hygrophoropsis aurantiaca]|uniref:Uncharacterized protein n=1 Tax=Hygrophoropsis aurantiaca TaxID=72124 RepID=A0ACB7ZZP4_9AGAM|nr:hypothetical protein BJ138DRAFT_1118119 [Hygrophoropsis aurantiaca]